jgi:hypothetical protein
MMWFKIQGIIVFWAQSDMQKETAGIAFWTDIK